MLENIKLVGLDVGSKTIGIAIATSIIPSTKTTIHFTEWEFEEGLEKLTEFIKDFQPQKVIFGYPLNMNGSISERAEMIDYFIEGFKIYNPNYNDDQIIRIDERRTSKMARSIMIEANLSREKQKKNKDSLAAVLILEQYLNSIK